MLRPLPPTLVAAVGEQAVHLLVLVLVDGDVVAVDIGPQQLGEHAALFQGGVPLEQLVQACGERRRFLGVGTAHRAAQVGEQLDHDVVVRRQRGDLRVRPTVAVVTHRVPSG